MNWLWLLNGLLIIAAFVAINMYFSGKFVKLWWGKKNDDDE